MSGGVLHVQDDDTLVEMTETGFESEAEFQHLLARYPRLLGDGPDGEPRRWLLVSREFGIQREPDGGNWWSVDHFFLDQDGVPTLVEVKRSTDTRIRREVVGQMLDYAANLVAHCPVEAIRDRLEARCAADALDLDDELARVLEGATDPEAFWLRVKNNLQDGRVRLVFVADRIPLELQGVVEFLNRHMDPAEVLAVELRQYVDQDKRLRTIVPRLLGQTMEAVQRKSRSRQGDVEWDLDTYIDAVASHEGDQVAGAVRRFIAAMSDEGYEVSFARSSSKPTAKFSVEGAFIPFDM